MATRIEWLDARLVDRNSGFGEREYRFTHKLFLRR